MIALLSWTFPLMLPPECLPSYRQRAGEYLGSDDRLEGKAAVGLSEGKLTIKLNRREHMAGGSKLVRALELHVPQLFRPACQLWPAVRELSSAGGQLLPG